MSARTPLKVTIAAVGVGLALAAAGPGFAGTTDRHTTFAFRSSGYGTRLNGGQLPASSGTTAFQRVACTDLAGRDKANDLADVTLPGLGTLSGVKTHTWTSLRHGVAASHATHSIAELTLASSGVGSLTIDAIHSRSTAFHNGSGFHSTASTTVGDITFHPTGGAPQTFPAPTPDQPVSIPGLATISSGTHHTRHTRSAATASADALVVDVTSTGSELVVAHSHATIGGGLTSGIFRGRSNATRVVSALTDLAHSGPQPLVVMGCLGTHGHRVGTSIAAVHVGDQLAVKGLSASERATQEPRGHGFERASVTRLVVGNGQLVVDGIVGRASVAQTAHGVVRSARGTRLGSITAGGKTLTFPRSGVLEVPGVARLERHLVSRTATGIHVVALQITLLDGSGAVVNLGEAAIQIQPVHG